MRISLHAIIAQEKALKFLLKKQWQVALRRSCKKLSGTLIQGKKIACEALDHGL